MGREHPAGAGTGTLGAAIGPGMLGGNWVIGGAAAPYGPGGGNAVMGTAPMLIGIGIGGIDIGTADGGGIVIATLPGGMPP